MRRLFAVLGLVVLCSCCHAQTVSFYGRTEDLLLSDKPFQADYNVVQKRDLPDGNQLSGEMQAHIVRDKNGRIRSDVKEIASGGKKPDVDFLTSFIYDPSAMEQAHWSNTSLQGTTQSLQPGIRYILTYASLNLPAFEQNTLTKIVPAEKSLGTKQILGLNCIGTQKTYEVPVGKWSNVKPIDVVEEMWWSPELELPVLFIIKNPAYGTLRQEMTKIDRTPPSPDLFKKPEQIEFRTLRTPTLPTAH